VKRLLTVFMLLLPGTLAFADDDAFAGVASLKVDLDQVVEIGAVSPVNGITSAGQPDEAALEVFADVGYVAVIDIRGADEDRGIDEARLVEEMGMHYVPFPIESKADISFENARKLDALIAGHDGPVLVHCGSANRVGALLALRESFKGADDEAALAHGREGGLTRLEDVVRERLAEGDGQAE
jgi:uncharacterized protein (TIGR01244 family)